MFDKAIKRSARVVEKLPCFEITAFFVQCVQKKQLEIRS